MCETVHELLQFALTGASKLSSRVATCSTCYCNLEKDTWLVWLGQLRPRKWTVSGQGRAGNMHFSPTAPTSKRAGSSSPSKLLTERGSDELGLLSLGSLTPYKTLPASSASVSSEFFSKLAQLEALMLSIKKAKIIKVFYMLHWQTIFSLPSMIRLLCHLVIWSF